MPASEQSTVGDPLEAATRELSAAARAEAVAKQRAELAKRKHSEAHEETSRRRKALGEIIAAEARKGRTNADIRSVTGYTRERVRQICRAAGVAPPE